MEEKAVRWSLKVSKDTDLTLRTFLGAHRMKKAISRSHRRSRPPARTSMRHSRHQGAQRRCRAR
jgi:hypothetical protein